jgi:hypothetical protein
MEVVYLPLGQSLQVISFDASANVFFSQMMQCACSCFGWCLPGMQLKQAVIVLSGWWRPASQTSQSMSRATKEDARPTVQSMQSASASVDWNRPGMQFKHVVVPLSGW